MKQFKLLLVVFTLFLTSVSISYGSGYQVTTDLNIRAVINTVEKGAIDAVWSMGGEETTAGGDIVIWGFFYASPTDVNWGSENNPDLYVKIWFDRSGRIDVNFFHVSVPDIDVYSEYSGGNSSSQNSKTTMDKRYYRHEFWIGSQPAYNIAEYFPLEEGDTWTYIEEDQELTTKVISGTENIYGVDAKKMLDEDGDYQLWTNTNGIKWYKEFEADDIPGCGYSQLTFNPSMGISGAIVTVGTVNTFTSTIAQTDCTGWSDTTSISGKFMIESIEDVIVPAGTFRNCIKIKGILTRNVNGSTQTSELSIWLAKSLGMVKSINSSNNGTTVKTWTSDLTSANVGGVSYPE